MSLNPNDRELLALVARTLVVTTEPDGRRLIRGRFDNTVWTLAATPHVPDSAPADVVLFYAKRSVARKLIQLHLENPE